MSICSNHSRGSSIKSNPSVVRNMEKLGEVIYLHQQNIKEANEASEAVDYLAEKGVIE